MEVVLSTTSDTSITVDLKKSDGSLVAQLSLRSGQPALFRPAGSFRDHPRHPLNTVVNGAGMTLVGSAPFSVNLRNVASDQLGTDAFIKGNASLTSFGGPGIGLEFRVGYYRDGPLPGERPIYSIMALNDETEVFLDGNKMTTLNKGQSYLFRSQIGSLVTTTKPCVMNTGAFLDAPGGCGDGTFDQIPPVQVLGKRYLVVRTAGNRISEHSTVIATEDQTMVRVSRHDVNGDLLSKDSFLLYKAGDFMTFTNGDGATPLSVAEVSSAKKIAIYSGSAQGCEVDVSTSFPISSPCHGSNYIQTTKFTTYRNGDLPYFCYVLLDSDTAGVQVNGVPLESLAGPRKRIGDSGLYMITCNSTNLGRPGVITFTSPVRLQVVIIQQGGGFSMSAAFSNLIEQPILEDPLYVGQDPCPIQSAILKVKSNYTDLQWYLNGEAINGANDSVFIATETGNYHVRALLDCGDSAESAPISITLDTLPQDTTYLISCDPVEWEDSIYTEEGTFTKIVKTSDGCDSLAVLVLDIHKPGSSTIAVSSCDEYYWDQTGEFYTISGLYVDTLADRFGCDSLVFLDLQVRLSDLTETEVTTCHPFFWEQTNLTYSQSGTYMDSMVNRYGCDSVLVLHLTFEGEVRTDLKEFACDSFYWDIRGQNLFRSGQYIDTLSTVLGCDSIVVLDLVVNKAEATIEYAETCDSYYWPVTRTYYDSSGLYTAQFSKHTGCDSLHFLDLTINTSSTHVDTVNALEEYYWPKTKEHYKEPGVYEKHYTNRNGCDSIHVLVLRIRQRGQVYIPNVFTPNGDLLNDRFVIHASTEIEQIDKVWIFDRWGELVFEQYEFPPNIEEYGWDGRLNGEEKIPAVYTYFVTWKDGEGDPHQSSGDVTLLR
jgi:gliding motility-associated-like protein